MPDFDYRIRCVSDNAVWDEWPDAEGAAVQIVLDATCRCGLDHEIQRRPKTVEWETVRWLPPNRKAGSQS